MWRYDVGGDIESKPAISAADNSVYGVSENNKITALNLNTGVYKWDFPLSTSSSADQDSAPEVGPDGTVYVGSDDNRLYALNPDGSEKWQFSTGGAVLSSPTINPVKFPLTYELIE